MVETNYLRAIADVMLLYLIWNLFTHRLASNSDPANLITAVHDGPVAPVDQLIGAGRIYLVQIGPRDSSYSLDDFAGWLRTKYGLDVAVLPAMRLDPSAWNIWRMQFAAELIFEQLKRAHPDLAEDENAYLVGFVDADMYSVFHNWPFSHTQRDLKNRLAVISSAHLRDTFSESVGVDESTVSGHLQTRLRRFLLKDIALLYWHLPLNNDPNSLLQSSLEPDLSNDDIYLSDLHPERTKWGRLEDEPCIFFGYSRKDGMRPLPGDLVRTCTEQTEQQGDSTELFQVDLRLGLLIDRHTDFYLPGSIPIQFQRVTRDGWKRSMAFGISGTHNYDKYLASADMRRISTISEDGGRYQLDRVPAWLPFLPFVRYVDASPGDSGKAFELRWWGSPFEHFDLKRFNGEVETYLPCDSQTLCSLIGYSNTRGDRLVFDRDDRRRLTRLTSPSNSWLHLDYGPEDRIVQISDSVGRKVLYTYDHSGRLIEVNYPSGEVFHYEYDDTQHLLNFSVSADATAAARLLLQNEYEHGRVVKQTLGDGKTYMYTYDPPDDDRAEIVFVRPPDGKTLTVDLDNGLSTVREHNTERSLAKRGPAH